MTNESSTTSFRNKLKREKEKSCEIHNSKIDIFIFQVAYCIDLIARKQ